MKVVLVSGTRALMNQGDWHLVNGEIHGERPDIVIHGGARGVDHVAERFCQDGQANEWMVPAMWKKHGKGAGPIRNQALVDIAAALARAGHDVVVLAFPGPSSRGTWDCVFRAKKAELTVRVLQIGGEP